MSHIPEPLVVLTQVLAEHQVLRSWLLGLGTLSAEERAATAIDMADRMRDGDEDPRLVQAIGALADDSFYLGISRVVRELPAGETP